MAKTICETTSAIEHQVGRYSAVITAGRDVMQLPRVLIGPSNVYCSGSKRVLVDVGQPFSVQLAFCDSIVGVTDGLPHALLPVISPGSRWKNSFE
jgi:hypothetical protein